MGLKDLNILDKIYRYKEKKAKKRGFRNFIFYFDLIYHIYLNHNEQFIDMRQQKNLTLFVSKKS